MEGWHSNNQKEVYDPDISCKHYKIFSAHTTFVLAIAYFFRQAVGTCIVDLTTWSGHNCLSAVYVRRTVNTGKHKLSA
jgi:hypothetical protein